MSYLNRLRSVAALALFLPSVALAQTDIWAGGFPNSKASVATNWYGQAIPSTIYSGTDTLEFNDNSYTYFNADLAGMSFNQILATSTGSGADAFITGSNAITLGVGGLSTNASADGSSSITIYAPIILGHNQTWGPSNGYSTIEVDGLISGTGNLTLNGGGSANFTLSNNSNSFSGTLTLSSGSTLYANTGGTALGTGTIVLDDGSYLQPVDKYTLTLSNPTVQFGNGATGGTSVTLGRTPTNHDLRPSQIVFSGAVIAAQNGSSGVSEIDLQSYTTVTFTGITDGNASGLHLDFGVASGATNTMAILQGDLGSNLSQVDALTNGTVILDGSGSSQIANLSKIDVYQNAYFGLGKNYAGITSSVFNTLMDPACVEGTIGLDTTSGAAQIFTDNIDLTNYSDSYFVGIGSATKAILSGTITPPGGAVNSTYYPFGGGGGTLTVTSPLVDGTGTSQPNGLKLNPGNNPLTLILSGSLSYSGSTYVDGGALIFNAPIPDVLNASITLGSLSPSYGYVGSTTLTGILNDDSGGAGTHPQDFINKVQADGSFGVIGFDDLSGASRPISGSISMAGLTGIYLGTSTKATYSGAIAPGTDYTLYFSGVKGGQVTVTSPSLNDGTTSALVFGLPTPMESYGSVSSVTLPTANLFNGNTTEGITLNSGYLYLGSGNSLGGNATNQINVTGPYDDGTGTIVGIAPYGASITLPNNINVPFEGLHLNTAGSAYTLTLTGLISNTLLGGTLIVDGPVVLGGSSTNTFTGYVIDKGASLTVTNDHALMDSNGLFAKSGSTVSFTDANPFTGASLLLDASTLTFTTSGAHILMKDLSMAGGSSISIPLNATALINGYSSDDPGSGNTIAIGSGADLTFELTNGAGYHGTITGLGRLTVLAHTLNLTNANTYSGGTTIGSGGDNAAGIVASNNNALGLSTSPVTVYGLLATNTGITVANPLTVENGATLAGYGTFSGGGSFNIQSYTSISPGIVGVNSAAPGTFNIPPVGSLTFTGGTNMTFGGGGYLYLGITNAIGAPGVGFGTVSIDGTLNITANSGSPFNIYVYSYAAGSSTPNTAAANFVNTNTYSWAVVTTGAPITGFDPADFVINTSNFNGLGAGGFYMSVSGDNLMLNFTPVPEPSTWALMVAGAGALGVFAWRRRVCAA